MAVDAGSIRMIRNGIFWFVAKCTIFVKENIANFVPEFAFQDVSFFYGLEVLAQQPETLHLSAQVCFCDPSRIWLLNDWVVQVKTGLVE